MQNFDYDFEKAIRFASQRLSAKANLTKPTLLHSIRVGIYLYQNGYERNTCIAGLLHDLIEDTETPFDEIKSEFNLEIAELVRVNSKNMTIDDKETRTKHLIESCATYSEGSAIIKAADILDNIQYYKKINNEENLKTMISRGNLLLQDLKPEFKDDIFRVLKEELTTQPLT